jgi:hypothetical protein
MPKDTNINPNPPSREAPGSAFRRFLQWLLWGPVRWHSRNMPTPKGQRLYATDGQEVWEIWGDGEPIGRYAIRVHFWARRREPMPPPPNVDYATASRLSRIGSSMFLLCISC